ncbi:hypothetical protein MCOR30_011721 [Pyricularia oryzae]|nr:hypothetical protein MCOR30_011721 [Pyricularia oryzae]
MVNGPFTFRNTHVKPYNRFKEQEDPADGNIPEDPIFDYPEPEQPKRRGRPKGAVNKRSAAPVPIQLEKEPETEITVQGLPPKTTPEDNGA